MTEADVTVNSSVLQAFDVFLFFVLSVEMEAATGFLPLLTFMALRVNTVHAGKASYI